MTIQGLFVGLVTLDLLYVVETLPQPNQKQVALDYLVAAGGPATNAAVAFQALGHQATVVGAVGQHALNQLALADLEQWGVAIADLTTERTEPLPTSSILVTQATGERAVVSLNAVRSQIESDRLPPHLLQDVQVILIDGHQMAIGATLAAEAKQQKIPIVVDGGSWKPGFEAVLAQADYVICSANFFPPSCQTSAEVFQYLSDLGVPQMAITQGGQPIEVSSQGDRFEVPVPQIQPVDTLGAGDIFHGAFCEAILRAGFEQALGEAAQVAAQSCLSLGTRHWIEEWVRRSP